MRIEQPAYLKALNLASSLWTRRLLVRERMLLLGLHAVLFLGTCSVVAHFVRRVAPWEWFLAAGMGPFVLSMFDLILRLNASGDRYAEIRDTHVRLRPYGWSFRASLLVYCKIRPDENFPEIHRLCFCFRLCRYSRPRYWSMMIDDVDAAEAFRRKLLERATGS